MPRRATPAPHLFIVALLGACATPLLACSSAAPAQSKGLSKEAADVVTNGTNPDGIAYPTANIGTQPRSGDHPGNIVKNYRFLGYRNDDPTMTTPTAKLGPISFADYYDPTQKRIKLIHVVVSSVWCVPCNQETDEIVGLAASLKQKGVVFLQAMSEGPAPGTAVTQTDLLGWVKDHQTTFTECLDPEVKNLGEVFNDQAVPYNMDIDPRTMELLDAQAGANSYGVDVGIRDWLNWIDAHPVQASGAKNGT